MLISHKYVLASLAAGLAFVMAPPSAHSAPPGSPTVRILSVTKILPADGTDVPVTFEVNGDAIIFEILVDSHPSDDAGLCDNTGGTPVTCTESDHRLVSMTIDGNDFRPGVLPTTLGSGDKLSIRPLFAQIVGSDVHLPLSGRSEFVMVFDTENGLNDVAIEVTVGLIGGQGATLD